MHVIVISGSRNADGQTGQAVKAMVEGIQASDATAEVHELPKLKIERCRQCEDDGWGICRSEGKCVIKDDFADLVTAIKAADSVVFATPVYFGDLSESLKSFLDRLRRTCVNESGREQIDGKLAVGICVAGGGGGGAPACTEHLDRTLRTCGFDVHDVISVRRQNLLSKLEIIRMSARSIAG